MKTTLIAIDAKFPHTNLAVRSLAAYARQRCAEDIRIAEFTINQRMDSILARLYALDSGAYVFSAYIWNIELVRRLAGELRKIRPNAQLWIGGPEVTYHSEVFLRDNPAFDLVIRGEGEETFTRLLTGSGNPVTAGATFRQNGEITKYPDAPPPDMDLLHFPYDDLESLQDRVLYYESMRGCPFSCAYCLSSIERGVRFRGLELVCADLQRFLDAGVRRVKLVDRTFNCDKARALAIWRFLHSHDNGVTNFHFEMAGELFDEETLEFLSTVRPGLFQFEIGVQSTNRETLREIGRPADIGRLREQVARLKQNGGIHLHLDLIAGLPFEDYASFARSFNEVYAMQPDQLQLGFLKVLKGSAIEKNAACYGLLYRDCAPYQVLATNWLDFGELARLSQIEDMTERYYNSGHFAHLIRELCARFPSPFAFYESLAEYWALRGCDCVPPDKTEQYELLAGFMLHQGIPVTQREQCLCKYDLALRERIKKLPSWIEDTDEPFKKEILAFYKNARYISRFLPDFSDLDSRQIVRRTYLGHFAFQPGSGRKTPVFLLFDYSRRDSAGNAHVQVVPNE